MQQSIENYDQVVEDNRIDKALAQAEAEYNSGAKLLDAKEVLSSLRRKHFN